MKKKNLGAKKKIHSFFLKKLEDPIIRNIYLNFKKKLLNNGISNFCVAVSGGSDSIALSFLSKCYSIENKKKIYFFIVDHNLRKNSSFEAKLVKRKLNSFDIKTDILTIRDTKKVSNLQAFARENRYRLIIKRSLNKKIYTILTAHHKDDLLENFFIRFLRGSGLKGLSSFGNIKSKIKFGDEISIVRPLLDITKKDLNYISKSTFDFKIEDPSNYDEKFLRVKVRKLISKLKEDGLNFDKFNKTLNNLNKSNFALDYFVRKNINENSNFIKLSKTIILNENFLKQPDEIVFRSFSELIQKVGKNNFYTRGSKVEYLVNYLRSCKKNKKKTLSGCIIQKLEKSVLISPEIL